MVTKQELNEKLRARFGKSAKEIARDPCFNVGQAYEYLKRGCSNLSPREYGRAKKNIDEVLLYDGTQKSRIEKRGFKDLGRTE